VGLHPGSNRIRNCGIFALRNLGKSDTTGICVSTAPDKAVPFYRNPWLYGAIIGLAFITFIRPWTRHEADATPVLGELEEFTLYDHNRAPFHFKAGKKPRLLSLVPADCLSPCNDYFDEMRRVHGGFENWEQDIGLLTITVAPPGQLPEGKTPTATTWKIPWPVFHTKPDTADEIVATGLFQFYDGKKPETAMEALALRETILVDGKNRVRGYFPLTRDGLKEAFHRAVQVGLEP
jgi:hypothetical protein